MMRRIKKIYFVLISVMLLFACGCANNHTTYTYDNPKEASGFTLNKAVYTKGKLKLYSPDFGGKFELTCYDNNFNVIEEEFETSYKDGVYTIKGKAAEKISGIVLQNYSTKYCIRYLDSNQYAAICYYEATEIGWTTSDDGENYYTEEERQKQKEAKESWQNRQKNNFELMLGEWTLLGDDKTSLSFYYDGENRKLAWTRAGGESGYHTDDINVDQIDIIEQEREIMLSITEGIDWGCLYTFSISEDMSVIKESDTDWNHFYIRADNDSTDYECSMLKMEMQWAGIDADDKQAEAAVKQLKQAGANKLVSAKWDYVDDQYVINVLTEEQTVYGVFLTDSGDVDRVEELTTAP